MKSRSIVFIVLFINVFRMDVFAQNSLVPVKKLHQDVRFYFKTIKEVHPNPYAFASKETVDSVEKKILNEIKKPMLRWELTRLIELNTNSLFDAHTQSHYLFLCISYPLPKFLVSLHF